MPSFEGNLLTQRHQITSLETRDPRLPYAANPESISLGLDSVPGRDTRTDGLTNRIPIANRAYALSAVPAGTAVARKNRNR